MNCQERIYKIIHTHTYAHIHTYIYIYIYTHINTSLYIIVIMIVIHILHAMKRYKILNYKILHSKGIADVM